MKNKKDFHQNGSTKIFKLNESATKIYEIPPKNIKHNNSSKNAEDYSDKKFNYISDMFSCFDK